MLGMEEPSGGKKTAGRRKIKMSRIDKESNRQVTFSKRKAGLFKKAGEISVMSGAQAAVFVLSNKHRPYSFANPASLVDSYLNATEPVVYGNGDTTVALVDRDVDRGNLDSAALSVVDQDNGDDRVDGRMAIVPREEENLWWWNLPVEGMVEEDFRKYKDLLEEMEMKLRIIVQEKKMMKKDEYSQFH